MYAQIVTSSLTVGLGGSAGLESPIVITGAAFGSNFAQKYHLSQKDRILLLACGVAAGIGAAFNAPIAGVLFAIEVVLTDVTISAFIPIIISAATGALISKISLFICLHCSMAINYNIMRSSYESMLLKPGEKKFSFLKDLLLSVSTLLVCNVFVYFVDSVTKILGIVGGISTVVISYFNPVMIYVLTNNYSRYSIYNLF